MPFVDPPGFQNADKLQTMWKNCFQIFIELTVKANLV